jgi:tetratricopeptide (TPR) repeat protein
MTLSERHFADAESEAKRAFALNANNEHRVEAKYVLGLAEALSGAKRQGQRTCQEAVDMARHANFQPLLPGALLALAEALLESGDVQGSLTNALEAQSLLERAGQQESEWRACLIAGLATLRTGDALKAREYATRVESLLSDLQRRWGAQDYNDYLTRPDIRNYRKSLSQILAVS